MGGSEPKSLYIIHVVGNIYGTKIEILAGFWLVGNTGNFFWPIMSNFWELFFHVFMGDIVVSAQKSCNEWKWKKVKNEWILNRLRNIGILLPKLFWPTAKKKTVEIWGWRPRICKTFEIRRTIHSNIERSEQFLVTECFFNLFLDVSHIQ